MPSCFEKCNDFAFSKTGRLLFWIVFLLASCFVIYRFATFNNARSSEPQSMVEVIPQGDDGSLIVVQRNRRDSYATQLNEFLAPYMTPHPNRQKCDYNNPPSPGKSCDFDIQELFPCSPSNDYDLKSGSVCVILKLRNKPNWLPEFYNASDLPSTMPLDLKRHIMNATALNKDRNVAWVSCGGENPADVENIGPIAYFPDRGFHFSQRKLANDSLEPLIAVRFEKPQPGVAIFVKCKLWTKNSDTDIVTFPLMYD